MLLDVVEVGLQAGSAVGTIKVGNKLPIEIFPQTDGVQGRFMGYDRMDLVKVT